jgi:hypothetical protein
MAKEYLTMVMQREKRGRKEGERKKEREREREKKKELVEEAYWMERDDRNMII